MIHPLQTECVNYLSQRTESLASLFMLAAMYCSIRSDEETGRARWILLAGVTSWTAALCKEIAAVGPILIIIYDLTFRGERATFARRRWPIYLAVISSWIPLAGLMHFLPRATTVGINADVTIVQYAMNQFVMIVEYIKLTVWPSHLLLDYGPPWKTSWLQVAPCAIAVVSLVALVALTYRRFPAVGFLCVSAFLLLAPTSSLIPVNTEVGAERRMYLPLAAVSVLCVMGICIAMDRCYRWLRALRGSAVSNQLGWPLPTATCVLLSLIALPLGARTIARNDDYRSPIRLWTQAVLERPDNHRAWGNLAIEWQQFDASTGARVFQKVLERWPDDAIAQFEVASYQFDQGNLREAVQGFRRTVHLDPLHDEATRRLVWLLAACEDKEVRNGPESLRLAKLLVARYPTANLTLDALAAAQAECGDFVNATTTMHVVVSKSLPNGGDALAWQQRLSLYQQGKPYRFGETAP
jgi:Flp pilus assembly protein TadD